MRRLLTLTLAATLAAMTTPCAYAQSQSSIPVATPNSDVKLGTETRTEGGETRHFERLTDEPSWVNSLTTGQAAVATPQTPIPLISGTPTPARWCSIAANQDNADYVVVGTAGVTTANGFKLYPGQASRWPAKSPGDCAYLYINAPHPGDGVSWAHE